MHKFPLALKAVIPTCKTSLCICMKINGRWREEMAAKFSPLRYVSLKGACVCAHAHIWFSLVGKGEVGVSIYILKRIIFLGSPVALLSLVSFSARSKCTLLGLKISSGGTLLQS